MPLNTKLIRNIIPYFVVVIGFLSVAKFLLIQFSMTEAERYYKILYICMFIFLNSVSISGFVAMVNFRVAWIGLALAQLGSVATLMITRTFGRGSFTINDFVLQHFIVVSIALILMIISDKTREREKGRL